jgi:hypothetical protein
MRTTRTITTNVADVVVDYFTNVQASYEKFKDAYSARLWLKSEMCKAGHVDIDILWEQLSPFLQLHVLASGSLIPKAELRAARSAVLGGQALPAAELDSWHVPELEAPPTGEKYCCAPRRYSPVDTLHAADML